MTHSESIANIAKALIAAQKGLKNPAKDKTVSTGSFSYKYSDLSSILDMAKPVLAENNLAITQAVENADGGIKITTLLMHESGEWISTDLSISYTSKGRMNAAQELGSAATYGRRYSIAAVLNIASDDDNDANSLQKNQAPVPSTRMPNRPPVGHSVAARPQIMTGTQLKQQIQAQQSAAPTRTVAGKCPECGASGKYHRPNCTLAGQV